MSFDSATLSSHFLSFQDEEYINLKEKAIRIMADIDSIPEGEELLIKCQEAASIVDYLISFAKNVPRMGVISCYPQFEAELDELYELEKLIEQHYPAISDWLNGTSLMVLGLPATDYRAFFNHCAKNERSQGAEIDGCFERYQLTLNQPLIEIELPSESLLSLRKEAANLSSFNQSLNYQRAINAKSADLKDLFIRIKRHQLDSARREGFSDPLDRICDTYGISSQSVRVMGRAMESLLNHIRDLINELEDHSPLSAIETIHHFERIAAFPPISIVSAKELIISTFEEADHSICNLAERAFSEHWIDWQDRPGKLIGNYTNNIHHTRTSLISTIYQGGLDDICKIAHELGHAYHGLKAADMPFFCSDYSVITSEAFALYCEYLLLEKLSSMHEWRTNQQWSVFALGKMLHLIIDNYASYQFEEKIFEFLMNNEKVDPSVVFNDILIRTAGVDYAEARSSDWMFRPHNFFPDNYYYNFVYLIGFFCACQIHSGLKNGGFEFADIENLLRISGVSTVDELFGMLSIDLKNDHTYVDAFSDAENLINLQHNC